MSSTDTISSDHPISRLYEHILIAWNQQDAAAMAAHFEEDGNLVGFDGSQVDSRTAIEDHLRPIFADHLTASYVAKVREIRMLGRDVGLLRGCWDDPSWLRRHQPSRQHRPDIGCGRGCGWVAGGSLSEHACRLARSPAGQRGVDRGTSRRHAPRSNMPMKRKLFAHRLSTAF
jgi:hypothetical protein